MGLIASASGDNGDRIMPYIADGMLKQHTWQLVFTIGPSPGTLRPETVIVSLKLWPKGGFRFQS